MVPDYFWVKPSSSSGNYHSEHSQGVGGLVRHVKSCLMIAHELLALEMYGKYTQDEKDMIIVSLLLHDCWKYDEPEKNSRHTVAEHPTICADWVRGTDEFREILSEEQIEFIAGCIASHTGQWNTGYRSKKEILPKPKTSAQKMVHQCDLLSSRRWLIVDFGDDYYTPEPENPEPEAESPVDELSLVLAEIVDLCKNKIEEGVSRNTIYNTIKEHNGGNRNPNSIIDIEVAKKVKAELEGLNVAS